MPVDPDDRPSDDRTSDDRPSDDRTSDDRPSDDRPSDDRTSDLELLAIGETMALVTPVDGSRLDLHAVLGLRSGGAESNVAATVARLGRNAAWASALGVDPLGDAVLAEMAGTGVDVSLVVRDPTRPTGVYFKDPSPEQTIVYYYRQGSAASGMGVELVRRWAERRPAVVHVSGITASLSDSCAALLRAVTVDKVFGPALVSFDVNYRPRLWQRPAADELLEHAQHSDVVFVGRDEAELLWQTDTAEKVRELVDRPRHLIVKDAAVEAVSFGPDGVHRWPSERVEVVDAVGAGDAFAAGWLAGDLADESALTKLRLGHHVAARVLGSATDLADVEPVVVIVANLRD